MNPIDPPEYNHIIQKTIQLMPKHTDKTAVMLHEYGTHFPKHLMDYSAMLDGKYLDNYQCQIEEILHRNPDDDWFKQLCSYQFHRYGARELFNDTSFFARINKLTRSQFLESPPLDLFDPAFVGSLVSGPDFGIDLVGGGTDLNSANISGSFFINKLTTAGIIGKDYNQAAANINAVSNDPNEEVGAYDDNAGEPENLYGQSESAAVATGKNFRSMTLFSLTTTANWAVWQASGANADARFFFNVSDGRRFKAHTFDTAFPDPAGTGYSSSSVAQHDNTLRGA